MLYITVVAFKVLPLGSYAPMPASSPPIKTILELDLWDGLQSCRRITPDVINVIKMPSFQYFLYLREQTKVNSVLWKCDLNMDGHPVPGSEYIVRIRRLKIAVFHDSTMTADAFLRYIRSHESWFD
jgi:hypothetical protein